MNELGLNHFIKVIWEIHVVILQVSVHSGAQEVRVRQVPGPRLSEICTGGPGGQQGPEGGEGQRKACFAPPGSSPSPH